MLSLDQHGFPVLLDTVPGTPAPKSGQGSTGAQITPPSVRPPGIDHIEWARRQDAVREAAREFEDLTEQDLKERLKGATTRPLLDGDLAQFRVDVRHQVVDDLVDALDQRNRGILRGRRTVRIVTPNGYLKKAMRSITADEADQMETRLLARGWSAKHIKADLRSKLGHLDTAKAALDHLNVLG